MNQQERIAYRITEWARAVGMGRRYIYEEIRAGRLRSVKLGRARVIRAVDGAEWLAKKAAS